MTKPCCCSNDVISFKMLLWILTITCLVGVVVCLPFNEFEKFATKVDGSTYCGDGSYEYCQAGQWFYDMKLTVRSSLSEHVCRLCWRWLVANDFRRLSFDRETKHL